MYETRNAGTQDFSDTNFLASLFGAKRSESEQTQGRNQYGNQRKGVDDIAQCDFRFILLLNDFIFKLVFKGYTG